MDDFSFFRLYAELLKKRADNIREVGLWNGKMGITMALFHLSRMTRNDVYKEWASNLIDIIYEDISLEMPYSFAHGLLGIGCGLQYLVDEGFVEGNTDEALSDIDDLVGEIIDFRMMAGLDVENGVCGVGCYLYYRLINRIPDDNSLVVLKMTEYLIYLIDWIEYLLCNEDDIQRIADAYFLLCHLNTLNVMSFKVKKMISGCLEKLLLCRSIDFSDNCDLLNMNSLKILKPWI